jgi:hypothetical protein
MAEILSPEEQSTALQESFDLVGALKAGHSKEAIASYLAEKNKFNIQGAKEEGYTDEQIIAHLLKGGASKAFGQEFIRQLGSSAQGIGQITGIADNAQIRAEKEASDIYGSLYPKTSIAGSFAGAILDPVALPTGAVAPLKAATLTGTLAKQGAAQGAFGGLLEPITKEGADTGLFNADRALNAIIGTAGGAAIGGGAGALIQRLTRKPAVPEVAPKTAAERIADELAAGETASVVRAADETAPVTRAADEAVPQTIETPAYLRRTEGRGVEGLEGTSAVKQLEDRLVKTEADIARAEERLFEVQQQPRERQQAALLTRGEGETPQSMGLVERMPGEQPRQTAALLRAAPQEPAIAGRAAPQEAKLTSAEDYLKRIIAEKTAEADQIKALLARQKQAAQFPIATKAEAMAPDAAAIAARDARIAAVMQRTGRAPEPTPVPSAVVAKEADIPPVKETTGEAPLTPAQQARVANIQKTLDENGFKTVDEAVAATAKTAEERAAAQARIDAGQSPTPEQLVRNPSAFNLGFGKQTAGAAQTPKELVYAEDVPFKTQVEKVLSKWQPRKVTVGKVLDQESTNIVNRVTQALGETGKTLRGIGKGPMSAENFPTRAAAGEASILKEHADLIDFVLKNPKNEWTSDQIAAVAPQFYESLAFVKNTLKEYNLLREAGKMTDEIKTNIMAATQMHLGVINIFQGQRSKASAKMNALRHAKDMVMKGEKIGGYATPGAGCN